MEALQSGHSVLFKLGLRLLIVEYQKTMYMLVRLHY